MEEKIKRYMNELDLSYEEAKQLYLDDMEVDKMSMGEVNSDLTDEQKKAVKTLKNSDSHARTKRQAPTRQEDTEKINIISLLSDFLKEESMESVQIVNKSKLITFTLNGNNYKLDLIKQRKPKA